MHGSFVIFNVSMWFWCDGKFGKFEGVWGKWTRPTLFSSIQQDLWRHLRLKDAAILCRCHLKQAANVLLLAVYHAHTSWAKGFWMHQAVPVRCSAMVIGNSRCFKTVCRPVLNLAASCSTRVADLQSDDGTVHSWSCPPFGRQVTAVGLMIVRHSPLVRIKHCISFTVAS